MNVRPRSIPHAERGVALAVSLVLLVLLSLVAVSTLSGTRLNERIASNAQQKAIAFEVAESAIDLAATPAEIDAVIAELAAAGNVADDPPRSRRGSFANALANDFDQGNALGISVDAAGEVWIQYCGEGRPRRSDLSADESVAGNVALLFDVNGLASIANTATRADHVRRVARTRPGGGRGGDCPTP